MPFLKGQSGNPAGRGVGEKLFRNALLASLKKADGDAEKIQRVADNTSQDRSHTRAEEGGPG
jgi:hypothetical protein